MSEMYTVKEVAEKLKNIRRYYEKLFIEWEDKIC